MNIITKKVRLIPAPVPFVGTILTVRVDDGLRFNICTGMLANKCDHIIVDWGDGTTQKFDGSISNAAHTFPAKGEYHIRISDDIYYIVIANADIESEQTAIYAPMVIGYSSNATRLTALTPYSFHNCVNLTHLDISQTTVNTISMAALKNCTALTGHLYFPKVTMLVGINEMQPFCGCTGLAAIHFALDNEAAIEGTTSYSKDKTLGTGVADICRFDL